MRAVSTCSLQKKKKERGLSAHVVASSFLLRVPQQLQPEGQSD